MTDIAGQNSDTLALAELSLRRYEARLGVWKVVLGTFIIGLAGIIIPAAINLTTLFFESWREEAQFELEKQTAHQQYIKDFFETAVNQDVELRIRFANYFANLSDGEQKTLWVEYLKDLEEDRDQSRDEINQLEAELVSLQHAEQTTENVTRLDRIARVLNWTYAEIGYVPLDRGTVQVVPGKKERLYEETISTISALTNRAGPIALDDPSYRRFWELHDRDLIGVESRSVASRMIAFGRELRRLVEADAPPSQALSELGSYVRSTMRDELAGQEFEDRVQRGLDAMSRNMQQQLPANADGVGTLGIQPD